MIAHEVWVPQLPSAELMRLKYRKASCPESASTTCRSTLMSRLQELVNTIRTLLLLKHVIILCDDSQKYKPTMPVWFESINLKDLGAPWIFLRILWFRGKGIESHEVIIFMFQLFGPHFHFVCQNASRWNPCVFIQAQYLGIPRF